jgi:hypothetical protein
MQLILTWSSDRLLGFDECFKLVLLSFPMLAECLESFQTIVILIKMSYVLKRTRIELSKD